MVQYRQSDDVASPPLDIDTLLEKMPEVAATDGTGSSLKTIRFTILDLGGIPISVDTVTLNVITTGDGLSYFGHSELESSPAHPVPWKQCRREPQCLKALLMARIRWFLDAAKTGAKAATNKLPFTKGCNGKAKQQAHGKQGHGGKHPHHHKGGHHGMHQGKFAHAFNQALHLIIVPALLGVLAGLVAIATGMLAGQLIVFVWLRHRRQTARSRPSSGPESGDDMEKEALIVDDVPPQYEDRDHGVIVLEEEKN